MERETKQAWAVLLLFLIVAVLAAGTDFVLFPRRLRAGQAYAIVDVRKYMPVSDGGGHWHFTYVGHAQVSCVRALLPHIGMWPCWWVQFERDEWTR